jgi:hypothetical protein
MGSQVLTSNTEAAILARLVQRGEAKLSQGAAEYLLSMRFDDDEIARMNELSELARQGTLSPEEERELDSYIHVGNLLGIMQSKARRALRDLAK